jgi:hypothetical protein
MKRLALLLALTATMAADCPGGDEDPTGPSDDGVLTGTWNLQSLNGDPLPAEWEDNGEPQTVTAGTIVVAANGNFTYTETAGGESDNTTGVCTLTTPPRTYTCDPNEPPGETNDVNGIAVVNGDSMTLTISESGDNTVRVYARAN